MEGTNEREGKRGRKMSVRVIMEKNLGLEVESGNRGRLG